MGMRNEMKGAVKRRIGKEKTGGGEEGSAVG